MQYLALTLPGGQSINPPSSIPHGGLNTLSKAIGSAITIMLIVAVVLTLIYLILGGIAWINSGGDKSKVASARSRVTFAIIGLIVALCSFLIVNIIGYFFNVHLLTP